MQRTLSRLVQPELEVAEEDTGRGEQGRDQKGLKCQAKILAMSLRLCRPGMNALLQAFSAFPLAPEAQQFFAVGTVLCFAVPSAASLTSTHQLPAVPSSSLS